VAAAVMRSPKSPHLDVSSCAGEPRCKTSALPYRPKRPTWHWSGGISRVCTHVMMPDTNKLATESARRRIPPTTSWERAFSLETSQLRPLPQVYHKYRSHMMRGYSTCMQQHAAPLLPSIVKRSRRPIRSTLLHSADVAAFAILYFL
jgi:hypothetical protein